MILIIHRVCHIIVPATTTPPVRNASLKTNTFYNFCAQNKNVRMNFFVKSSLGIISSDVLFEQPAALFVLFDLICLK